MNQLVFTRFPKLEYASREAINTLCTNLTFLGDDYKKIVITSANGAEGKTFLSTQIMRTLSELGRNTALIDADLRHSVIQERHQIDIPMGGMGLTHYLAGQCEIDDVVYATNIPRAYLVPVGRLVSNSLALLNSQRFRVLLDELNRHMDYVIVDAPPIGLIVDASEIAKSCDGAIIAIGYNMVRKRELQETQYQLELSGCSLVGCVLNHVPLKDYNTKKYFGKYYSSSYKSQYAKYYTQNVNEK